MNHIYTVELHSIYRYTVSSNYMLELLADGAGETLIATADEDIADGQTCAYSALVANTPHVHLANRDSATRTPCQLIALGDYTSGQKSIFLRRGIVRRSQFDAYTYGTPLYLSSTRGGLTSTAPRARSNETLLAARIRLEARLSDF